MQKSSTSEQTLKLQFLILLIYIYVVNSCCYFDFYCYISVPLLYIGFMRTKISDHHDITEMLLKVALNTIDLTKPFVS
jgi:hypothetical protein